MTRLTPPIDIWEVAEAMVAENEDALGIPNSYGPLDEKIDEKLAAFESWDDVVAAWKIAYQPVFLVESFLHEVYGVTGLFL